MCDGVRRLPVQHAWEAPPRRPAEVELHQPLLLQIGARRATGKHENNRKRNYKVENKQSRYFYILLIKEYKK